MAPTMSNDRLSFQILLHVACLGIFLHCKPVDNVTTMEPISFMALEPGHFHAGLIHKEMYPGVDSTIHVFAPEGKELEDYLQRINGYNKRLENPTAWQLEVWRGEESLAEMIRQKPGQVMVVAGKNNRKIDYILSALQAGLHVFADKPLAIDEAGFQKLKTAFSIAGEENLLLYDIMTERFEICSMLQRELAMEPEIFGSLEIGSLENPAITKESVHHFFKYVSGVPLVRPPWFFDVEQEGEGIVDVTTHLVDLIQWTAFPNQLLDTADIVMLGARRWPTDLDLGQFRRVTGEIEFPDYLQKDKVGDRLAVFCNGEMQYTIKGVHAKVGVVWAFEAQEGGGDTHFSKMRGTRANLIVLQGKAQNFRPSLFVELLDGQDAVFKNWVEVTLASKYPGIGWRQSDRGLYEISIPDQYHVGHEAHFGQVTKNFLAYLENNKLPEWEVPNMLVKYFTTSKALEKARSK